MRRPIVLVLVVATLLSACQSGSVSQVTPGSTATPPASAGPPTPRGGGMFTVYSPLPAASAVGGLAVTADGSAWFTEANRNAVGRITATGTYTEFRLPTPDRQPHGLAVGPDGGVWFGEQAADQVGHLGADGHLTEFGGVTPTTQPWEITAGPDGNMWFTEAGQEPPRVNRVARITPGGHITEYPARVPDKIATGADGALWFTAPTQALGRITTAGTVTYVDYNGPVPEALAAGPDGALWVAGGGGEDHGARVIRVSTAGAEQAFPVDGPPRALSSITAGGDGNLWFCDPDLRSLGRMTPGGQVREFSLPASDMVPGLVAAGPGHLLWVALADGRMVKVTTPA